ncbi:MAG: hypothetical protein NUV65_04275 [Candidatus Roizmanbacteria bacterium]|nr:hypothetical protein [Candidatus Roizmanbacteria bacterium]
MKNIRVMFRKHALFICFIAFYLSTLSYKLIANPTPFFDWDEPLYVQGGIEMLRNNYFLFPLWQGHIWFDKPPLSSLFYGLVTYLPFPAEVTTRMLALSISSSILTLFYVFYYRITKYASVATLAVVGTALAPIFLQRSQVVSLDVFLLIGWIGYFVFQKNLLISTPFLFLSIQSKSLLGFYPLVMQGLFVLFELFRKKITKKEFILLIRIVLIQFAILSLWYIAMFIIYGNQFWTAHIIESHFKRVSSSIESHFGQRTFYLDLLIEQLGWLKISALLGVGILAYQWYKGIIDDKKMFFATVFIPWFIFLNLTKTKIAWYLYPVIPQFMFLSFYPLILLKKFPKILRMAVVLCFVIIIYISFVKKDLMNTYYSTSAPHIYAALYARGSCNTLAVLVDTQTRTTYDTLHAMNLTITTSDWWGDHPSMVYYFAKPIHFFYDKSMFLTQNKNYDCALMHGDDVKTSLKHASIVSIFDDSTLYKIHP